MMAKITPQMIASLRQQAHHALARRNFLYFAEHTRLSSAPYLIGYHTRLIAQKLQEAVEKYVQGESTKLIITVPFRHGKSELSSRAFPPYVFGHIPDAEIMLVCYSAALASEFSRDAMQRIQSENYRKVFPQVQLDGKSKALTRWGIFNYRGKFAPVGIGGSITGKGADVLIVDDYLRSRSEAESVLMRDKIWSAFTNDLLTRLAPVHICIIVATRWHEDDLIGRILLEQSQNSNFPQFELLKFPAKSENYESCYLFPERFTADWYENQFASLGQYGASALLQCEPTARGGNLLVTDKMIWHDSLDEFPENLRYVRFWDLASSEKERVKNDPDYTVGTKLAVGIIEGKEHLFIADVQRVRAEAPARNRLIVSTAQMDGRGVRQGIEAVAGYKDTYTMIKELLKGVSIVEKVSVSGDKVSRASYLEPLFDAGFVHVLRATWNNAWLDELSAFPLGKHDDQVDSLAGAYAMLNKPDDFFYDSI